jgi:hypothetical protein
MNEPIGGGEGRPDRCLAEVSRFQTEISPQSYERLEELVYRYESGNGRFVVDLPVNSVGFVVDYPSIWLAEAGA